MFFEIKLGDNNTSPEVIIFCGEIQIAGSGKDLQSAWSNFYFTLISVIGDLKNSKNSDKSRLEKLIKLQKVWIKQPDESSFF